MIIVIVVVITVDVDAILFCDSVQLLVEIFGIFLVASYYLAVVCAGEKKITLVAKVICFPTPLSS